MGGDSEAASRGSLLQVSSRAVPCGPGSVCSSGALAHLEFHILSSGKSLYVHNVLPGLLQGLGPDEGAHQSAPARSLQHGRDGQTQALCDRCIHKVLKPAYAHSYPLVAELGKGCYGACVNWVAWFQA